jgi:transcriptional regulator with XRE-family HTH domain
MGIIEHNKLAAIPDKDLVKYIGRNLQKLRLKKNLSQQQIADFARMERATISKLENGRAATLMTLVQVLRALKKLDWLEALESETELSPLQIAEMEGKKRQRASVPRNKSTDPTPEKPKSEW